MSSLKSMPTLPPGTKPLDNQVAGHQNTDGKIGKQGVDSADVSSCGEE